MLYQLRRWKTWFFITMLIMGKLYSQPIGIKSMFYDLDDGLSDRLITGLHYVEPGFLWVATQNGLNRFEGYQFSVFSNHSAPPQYISESNIKELLVNKKNHLVLTYNNAPYIIDILDPSTAELNTIKLSPLQGVKGLPRSLFSDRDKNIFFSTLDDDGLRIYSLDTQGNCSEVFFLEENYSSRNVDIRIIHLMDSTFVINDALKGLRWYDNNGQLLKSFSKDNFSDDAAQYYPSRSNILFEDIRGRVWLSFHKIKGLYRWEPMQENVEVINALSTEQLYADVWEDPKGNLLFSQSNGFGFLPNVTALHLLNLQEEWRDFSFLLKEASNILAVASSSTFDQDIYLGMDTGLKVVENRRSTVETILAQDIEDFRRGTVINGIEEDYDGNVFFANVSNNWYRWNPQNKILDTLLLRDSFSNRTLRFNCSLNIKFDQNKEYLWGISCNADDEGQLHKMNPKTGKVITYRYPFKFTDLEIGQNGTIWLLYTSQIGTSGLLSFNPQRRRFIPYFDGSNNILANSYPRYIMEDSRQRLWVGTDNGLFCIDPLDRINKRYTNDTDDNTSARLSSTSIYVIHEDENGCMWLGTTEGINKLNPDTDSVTVYNMKNGLPNNIISGIQPDAHGNYWISTFYGLSYLNTENKTFKNFYKEDGLTHNQFNPFSYHRAQDGLLYFGTVNGLNIINSEDLFNDTASTDIFLTKFSIYDRRNDSVEVKFTNLNNTKKFVISPYVSYFQFDVALSNFVSPNNNRFSAWLKGVEKDYSYLGKSNYVRYNKVPSGKHQLYIKGAHSNGNWSEPIVVDIIVKKFFYQQAWFIILFIILLGLVAYGIFRYILNQQIRLERLRTKISSDLHDEVSGLLAGIAIQSDILKLKSRDEDHKNKLRQIGEVSRKAISKMGDVIWSIDSRNDRVEDLLQRMKEHLMEVLNPKDIAYYIETQKINPKAKIPVNVRQDLYLIFKEAINNIAKHSDASEVTVRLSTEGKSFKMMVQDNGSSKIGHKNGKFHRKKGQGMANMRMRAHRLKGDLVISNRKGYMINLSIKKFG